MLKLIKEDPISTSYLTDVDTYIIPNVNEEDSEDIINFAYRSDNVQNCEWNNGQIEIECDPFTFQMLLLWAYRKGFVMTDRRIRDILIDNGITESVRPERRRNLKEQNVDIEVKNKGILEVPEGKNVDDLPMSHFEKLVKKHGLSKITKALNNLQVWNKNDDKKLSKWAGNMIDKLTKKYGKDESMKRRRRYMKESGMYDYYDTPDNEYGMFMRDTIPDEDQTDRVYKRIITVKDDVIEEFAEFVANLFNEDIDDVVNNRSDNVWMDDFDSYGNKHIAVMCDDDTYREINRWVRKHSRSNLKNESRKMYKESTFKSYWKYSVLDPVFDRDEDDDTYLSKYDIRRVKLIPCDNPDECYDDTYSAVCDYEYPYDEFYGTKQDAYDMLLTSWNNSTFERIHDI